MGYWHSQISMDTAVYNTIILKVKKNVFIYGPEFPVWDPNYLKSRLLPKILDEKTMMFRYYSCIFRISKGKRSTARGVFC